MIAGLIAAWQWLRAHATPVLGGFVVVLSALLMWGSMRRRTTSLRATVRSEQLRRVSTGDVAVAKDALRRDAELARDDEQLQREIEVVENKVAEVPKQEMSNAEVIEKLNEMHRRKRR